MIEILLNLREYLLKNMPNNLPDLEMLDRIISRVRESGIDEYEILIKALKIMERIETGQRIEALELETRNLRDIKKFHKSELDQAIRERNASNIIRLNNLQELLDNPPKTAKRMSVESIIEAEEIMVLLDQNPNWSLKDVVVKRYNDCFEYQRIRKLMQRYRKHLEKENQGETNQS